MRMAASPVEVRTAGESDFHSCITLDDSFSTTHTWQVEVVRGEPGAAPVQLKSSVTLGDHPLSVILRPVKLPRARKVQGPAAAAMLKDGGESAQNGRVQALKTADLVLIAEQGTRLCGYMALTVVPGSGIGWISALVVGNSCRRQGIGSMLLAAARRWARYEHGQSTVRAFMLELPTRNYPAVAFCRRQGFNFCGYTDYSFSNGETVLLFASPVVI